MRVPCKMYGANYMNLSWSLTSAFVLSLIISTWSDSVKPIPGQEGLAERIYFYVRAADELLQEVKDVISKCADCPKPIDCEEILQIGYNVSGMYMLYPRNRVLRNKTLPVYCDMDTDGGGWTVIQRRGDFGKSHKYFYKDWRRYKAGFGDLMEDFWLGNDNIFALTNQRLYSVRFDLRDVTGVKKYALYDEFWIDCEDYYYTLHIKGYSGDAGDEMSYLNGMQFSTRDRSNPQFLEFYCSFHGKGGWWYKDCGNSNLNGFYLKGKYNATSASGIFWKSFKGIYESLEMSEIKIRPKLT